jgi:ankyrin repeat protein
MGRSSNGNRTALHNLLKGNASEAARLQIAELLLQHVDASDLLAQDKEGCNVLHAAAGRTFNELTKLLVKHSNSLLVANPQSADPLKAKNAKGQTSLDLAREAWRQITADNQRQAITLGGDLVEEFQVEISENARTAERLLTPIDPSAPPRYDSIEGDQVLMSTPRPSAPRPDPASQRQAEASTSTREPAWAEKEARTNTAS